MLASAKSSRVEMCASEDRIIGECKTIGSVFICELCNKGHGDMFGTAKDISECSRS